MESLQYLMLVSQTEHLVKVSSPACANVIHDEMLLSGLPNECLVVHYSSLEAVEDH